MDISKMKLLINSMRTVFNLAFQHKDHMACAEEFTIFLGYIEILEKRMRQEIMNTAPPTGIQLVKDK